MFPLIDIYKMYKWMLNLYKNNVLYDFSTLFFVLKCSVNNKKEINAGTSQFILIVFNFCQKLSKDFSKFINFTICAKGIGFLWLYVNIYWITNKCNCHGYVMLNISMPLFPCSTMIYNWLGFELFGHFSLEFLLDISPSQVLIFRSIQPLSITEGN